MFQGRVVHFEDTITSETQERTERTLSRIELMREFAELYRLIPTVFIEKKRLEGKRSDKDEEKNCKIPAKNQNGRIYANF